MECQYNIYGEQIKYVLRTIQIRTNLYFFLKKSHIKGGNWKYTTICFNEQKIPKVSYFISIKIRD